MEEVKRDPDGRIVEFTKHNIDGLEFDYGTMANMQNEIYHVFRIEGKEYEIYSVSGYDRERKFGFREGMTVSLSNKRKLFPKGKEDIYERIIKEIINRYHMSKEIPNYFIDYE